ncbi:hypothetical protein PM3016_1788 [Paenibacillus mucilaginosus 3016]|uniref:Metallo-beta-lactamase domain-containing protein n=1 Tax=Paenibacillus mucilaginosus 3016 TaxID=1116391 RepID=H6NH20_9BACL|nr:MBL fold metallo-hydrolase [Paenibacillus mucilaginosus]AFC28698.1 hypothetical protein PM3016_1788 [Paenibacillus mucilaginosus 3016]WFA17475.1 MBL fold metallo-hydrolase [Paenibacillus mucilaginosus]
MDNPMKDTRMPMTSVRSGEGTEVLKDLYAYTVKIVNVVYAGSPERPGDGWVLMDAGLPGSAEELIGEAEARFGPGARPQAILLTHGHFDHAGAVVELAQHWQVPVYAHEAELPFVTGRSRYPDADPGVEGGLLAKIAGWFPNEPVNLEGHVHPLPADGTVPGLPGWRWIHTPGHTPGHVSFFRDADRALVAGDAFVNVRQDKLYQVLTQMEQLSGPPRYFTPDWPSAGESVRKLAALQPRTAVTGHGEPLAGEAFTAGLAELAAQFERVAVPDYGRYVDGKR